MLLARAGRQDAFEIIVKRHQTLVRGLATRFFADRVAGRDVAQDVFMALWAQRDRYRAQGKFRSYLVSVALHRCHTLLRKQKTRSEYLQRQAQTGAEPEPRRPEEDQPIQQIIEREKARQIREMLSRIPEKQRRVLILRFTLDLSFEEIAAITGLPLGTVKSHALRGLKRLRTHLHVEKLS
jgi:RNA polymerase sigma-70 factor (ECF subfamily)